MATLMPRPTFNSGGMLRKRVVVLFIVRFTEVFFFFDVSKLVGSVLKNSDAKYNVEKVFQSHLPVVETGACVVAESSRRQKKPKE